MARAWARDEVFFSGIATIALAIATSHAVRGDDFFWTGGCGTTDWNGCCQISTCAGGYPLYENNWNLEPECFHCPAYPTSSDNVYLGSNVVTVDTYDWGRAANLYLDRGGLIHSHGPFSVSGDVQNNGTILVGGSWYLNYTRFSGDGVLLVGDSDGPGALDSIGTLIIEAGQAVRLGFGGLLGGHELLVLDGPVTALGGSGLMGRRIHINGTITIESGAELVLGWPFDYDGEVVNDGIVKVESRAILQNRRFRYLRGAGTLVLNGNLMGNMSFYLESGTLSGCGTIAGGIILVNDGGTISPGDPVGALVSFDRYYQGPGGHLHIKCRGTQPSDYGSLTAYEPALDGTVHVEMIDSFVPQVGDTFDIVHGSYSGQFSTLDIPPYLAVEYLDQVVRLRVVCSPGKHPLYVRSAATGANNGCSWDDAYTDLQSALNNPNLVPGDEIWVAGGTYTPGPAGDRSATFRLPDGVTVYGGFAGWETDPNERDPNANPTLLSGDLAGDDAPDFANRGDNAFHVVTAENVGNATILDGFIVSSGNADASGYPNANGGGLFIHNAGPIIRYCTLSDNQATWGGSMDVLGTGAPRFISCQFNANRALNGGGAVTVQWQTQPEFQDCSFSGNQASGSAGVILTGGADVTITADDCTFTDNTGRWGGVLGLYESSAGLTNCSFINNRGVDAGGAMVVSGANLTLTNCTFRDNRAIGFDAGAIQAIASVVFAEGCSFENNRALNSVAGAIRSAGTGGQLALESCSFSANRSRTGGALSAESPATADITNCSFQQNEATATFGGAINGTGDLAITGCVFSDNSAVQQGGAVRHAEPGTLTAWSTRLEGNHANFGGALFTRLGAANVTNCFFLSNSATVRSGALENSQAAMSLVNCTLYDNAAPTAGGIATNNPPLGSLIANCSLWANREGNSHNESAQVRNLFGPLVISHSCIEGWTGVLGGTANVGRYPSFRDPAAGDCSLLPHSPCIDAGDNRVLPLLLITDLADAPRFHDDRGVPDCRWVPGTCGVPPVVDIGCYEFQGWSKSPYSGP